jgi:hypothetical protein
MEAAFLFVGTYPTWTPRSARRPAAFLETAEKPARDHREGEASVRTAGAGTSGSGPVNIHHLTYPERRYGVPLARHLAPRS